jgi:hypothetical protein
LSRPPPDLPKQARAFAGELTATLNGTVTDGIRLSVMMDAKGRAVIGYRLAKDDLHGKAIDLTVTGSPARLRLRLHHTLVLDESNRHLTTDKSTYTLVTADEDLAVLTYDYVRDPPNKYPEAHLHIDGEARGLQQLLNLSDRAKNRPADLHLPVGGRRYRPSLEDLVEFCILEEMVTPRPDWRTALDASRDRFHTQQLRAAVRRKPDEAISVLREIGWTATTPNDT